MMEIFFKAEVLWVAAGLFFFIAELITPGFIVIFFGFGALFVALLCFLVDISLNVQLTCFLLFSLLLLFFLRSKVKSVFTGNRDNFTEGYVEDITGEKAVVVKKIEPATGGKVFFRGTEWEADSDSVIEADESVIITGRKSIRLVVKPTNKTEVF